MSTPTPTPTITRTYRVAVKHGDDYTTVEETITLSLDASDEDVQRAVDLGWHIFAAQREASEAQIDQIRAAAPEPAPEPASDGQRKLIDALADELRWPDVDLDAFAAARGITGWGALTKRQASSMIDAMKAAKVEDERQRAEERAAPPPAAPAAPAPDPDQLARARQVQAEAHARAGMAPPDQGPRRPVAIRDPEAPASDPQIALIRRKVAERDDASLKALAPEIAALFGATTIEIKRLRAATTWVDLRDRDDPAKRLTKGRASDLITLLDREERRAAA